MPGSCLKKKGEYKIRSYAYTSTKTYDCDSLTSIVLKRPVSVGVEINLPFIYYSSGVFTGCDPIVDVSINHALLVTGIVQNSLKNYYICRNSWGTNWGELGYIRIDRSMDYGNHCQICLYPIYSIIWLDPH